MMSCNYADGLSPYQHKGKCGLPELFDDEKTMHEKTEKLADWIRNAKHVVVHTGAGISTAAGIPDFRGPSGVWTLESKGEKPKMNISFDEAQPTLTHMALLALYNSGFVHYVVTQNVDGLHLRSGLPRSCHSELHGNMFVEQCAHCERQFVRSVAVPSVGEKCLNKPCPVSKPGGRTCRGKLHDTILDWEAELPFRDLEFADLHSRQADLSLCLGSTLQIIPSGNLPLHSKKNKGKVVICNLQPTKHDNRADLIIHSYVDNVISNLCKLLGVTIGEYAKNYDPTFLAAELQASKGKSFIEWTLPEPTRPQNNVNAKKKGACKRKYDDDKSYTPNIVKLKKETGVDDELIKVEVCSEIVEVNTEN